MAWKPGDPIGWTKALNTAAPFIRGAVAQGISATKTAQMLKSAGMGARYQSVLQLYSAFEYSYTDPSVYIPSDVRLRPNADVIPLSITSQNRTWRTTMWYDVYSAEEQDIVRRHVTIDEDDLLTIDEYHAYTGQLVNKYWMQGEELLDIGFESITFSDNPRSRL
jgi:hypothetical protein